MVIFLVQNNDNRQIDKIQKNKNNVFNIFITLKGIISDIMIKGMTQVLVLLLTLKKWETECVTVRSKVKTSTQLGP